MNPLASCGIILFAGWVAVSDLRTRRIPNGLVVSGAALGVAFAAAADDRALVSSLLGLLTGLLIGFLLVAVRALGAGDAKFMAAIGAWAGWERLPLAYGAMLAGGAAFAILWSARHRLLGATLWSTSIMIRSALRSGQRLPPVVGATKDGKFPYGVGLALGAIAWWFWAGGSPT